MFIRSVLAGFVCVLLVLCSGMSGSSAATIPNSYEQGLAHRDSGDWQKAIETWLAAKDSTRQPREIDPRIGFAFIELVAEKKAEPYYDKASEMYLWAFEQEDLKQYEETIREEIAGLSPIMSKDEGTEWLELLEKGDPKLNDRIRGFWTRADPIPTTETNERLVEHWRRIAHAREKYTREKTTVYGTDDRGLVFVKYGPPDVAAEGKLGVDQFELMRWFPTDFLLRQEIQRYNTLPEFEIWVYHNLGREESTVFVFGKRSGLGKFGLRYGIEAFIPNRAFSRRSTKTTDGVLPGAMLQLMFYRELIDVDMFFLNRYRELEAIWANSRAGGLLSPNYDRIKGIINHYKNEDKATIDFEFMPATKTNTLEGLEALELKYKRFRHLDEANHPLLTLMTAATSLHYGDIDHTLFFREARKSKYKQRHFLVVHDEAWHRKERHIGYPAMHNTNTSVFSLQQNSQTDFYTLVAEKTVLEHRSEKLQAEDIPDTASVVGIGTLLLGEVPPLQTDSTRFEISDIVFGVETPGHLDRAEYYPFPVIPKDPVKRSDSLKIYFEAYHLTTPVLVEYRIEEKKEGEDGRAVLTGRVELNRSRENVIDLDVSHLSAGDYILKCSVTSAQTGEKKTRSAAFRVIG
ncbi:GWxTD domain-containing protein [candidate division KSB1 bacterium]|nr:GWxTD domain-containing protein [candidate division KSB1 bacterium]